MESATPLPNGAPSADDPAPAVNPWTGTITSISRSVSDLNRAVVQVTYENPDGTTDTKTHVVGSLADLDQQIQATIARYGAIDTLIDAANSQALVGSVQSLKEVAPVPDPIPTADDIARSTFYAEDRYLRALQDYVARGVMAADDPALVAQLAAVKKLFDPAFLK